MPDLATLLDDARTFTALEHFSAVAAARQQGYEDGRAIERVVVDRVLSLLREAVEARRRRLAMDGSDVDAVAAAEDVETSVVCALLDHGDTLFSP